MLKLRGEKMKMFKKNKKSGFTLMEMLVVITIISILAAAMVMGYGSMTKTAQRAKAVEAISQAAQALVFLRDKHGGVWPKKVLSQAGSDGSGKGMDKDVAKAFAAKGLLGVAKDEKGDPIGINAFGVFDPWAEAVLKKSKATVDSTVSSGGKVRDHIIYFAVDGEGEGITEATVGGETIRVRASAIACR